jgi:hypothetical protein
MEAMEAIAAEMDLRPGGSRKMGKMTERLRKQHFGWRCFKMM